MIVSNIMKVTKPKSRNVGTEDIIRGQLYQHRKNEEVYVGAVGGSVFDIRLIGIGDGGHWGDNCQVDLSVFEKLPEGTKISIIVGKGQF